MGQRPLLCPLHGARCDATPARTCITMSRYEAQYGTGGLIPASTLTLIIPESSSDLYEDLLSLPPSVPSGSGSSWQGRMVTEGIACAQFLVDGG